jgi:hypothetical protein
MYTKVLDLAFLYDFCKGRRVIFSTIFAQIACQDAEILDSSE